MTNLMQRFIRDEAGAWICREAVDLYVASGRIEVTPGTRFAHGTVILDVDIAKLLDSQLEGFTGSPPSRGRPLDASPAT